METPAAAPKQRSPWFYVLLGCGGLAGLMCLGTAVLGLGLFKTVKDIGDGVNDPQERQANALKQLGAIPDGYHVVASLSFFGLMQTTVLTDRPPLEDGGLSLSNGGRSFTYFRIVGNENNQKARDFLTGKESDPKALAQSGINLQTKQIVKRGQLTVDGRKVYWLASLGELDTGAEPMVEKHETVMIEGKPVEKTSYGFKSTKITLNNAILFDCPGDALQVGIWAQPDPDPEKDAEALELAGTVADEAELVRFLKPMNPCGK
jgi:hypothetical protein